MNITLIDPALKGILPIYSNHAERGQAASPDRPVTEGAVLGAATAPQFQMVNGQYIVEEPAVPASGPHNVVPHSIDPPSIDPLEHSVTTTPRPDASTTLNGQEAVHVAPAATEVRPAAISNPKVKP